MHLAHRFKSLEELAYFVATAAHGSDIGFADEAAIGKIASVHDPRLLPALADLIDGTLDRLQEFIGHATGFASAAKLHDHFATDAAAFHLQAARGVPRQWEWTNESGFTTHRLVHCLLLRSQSLL